MASNYTTNYKLPLWEGGDNFVREEFNAANKTVDTALARVEGMASTAPVLLATAQLESAVPSLTLDVSHIDFTQYDALQLLIRGLGETAMVGCKLQVNGETGSTYLYRVASDAVSAATTLSSYFPLGACCTMGMGGSVINCQIYDTGESLLLSSVSVGHEENVVRKYHYQGAATVCGFSALKALNVIGESDKNFAAGMKVVLLGHKYAA